MEQECSELAARLVRGQVDRAHGEEETFALERELHALRCANLDAQQALSDAHEEIRSLELTLAEVRFNKTSAAVGMTKLSQKQFIFTVLFLHRIIDMLCRRNAQNTEKHYFKINAFLKKIISRG